MDAGTLLVVVALAWSLPGTSETREVLRFDGTHITYTCPEECWCGQTIISCIGGGLTELPPLPRNAPDIRQVWLTDNKIKSVPRAAFASLPGLISVDLDDNDIDSVDPQAFEGLPKLRAVYLSYNRLASMDLSPLLRGAPDLRVVDLAAQKDGTQISCDVVKTVNRERPGNRISLYYNEPCSN